MAKQKPQPDPDDEAHQPGPDPERLKLDMDFDEAGKRLVMTTHWVDVDPKLSTLFGENQGRRVSVRGRTGPLRFTRSIGFTGEAESCQVSIDFYSDHDGIPAASDECNEAVRAVFKNYPL